MKAAVRIAATKAELNRYFEMINRHVPGRVAQSIEWLRKPSSFATRLLAANLTMDERAFDLWACATIRAFPRRLAKQLTDCHAIEPWQEARMIATFGPKS